MKTRPIIFSGLMAQAILEGRKTQTRRVIKPQPEVHHAIPHLNHFVVRWRNINAPWPEASCLMLLRCPYLPGDRFWVRETWAAHPYFNSTKPSLLTQDEPIWYRASYQNESHLMWRPSIFMPRWASRITLEVTGLRVGRVQDISEESAIAEGIEQMGQLWRDYSGNFAADYDCYRAKDSFASLWDSINAKRGFGWDVNPWIWAIEFRKLEEGEHGFKD